MFSKRPINQWIKHKKDFETNNPLYLLACIWLTVLKAQTLKITSSAGEWKRIVDRIAELAKFGIDEKGRGYRVAYSKAI
jgi:hypothetical protein